MSEIGQLERKTQDRLVKLFQEQLGYRYLGNLADHDNTNIRADELASWLAGRGIATEVASRALESLLKASTDTTKSLYDRNRAVYELLRYGVKVKADPSKPAETVFSKSRRVSIRGVTSQHS